MANKCIHLEPDNLSQNVFKPTFAREQGRCNENNVNPSCEEARYVDVDPNAEANIKDTTTNNNVNGVSVCRGVIKKLQDDYNILKEEHKRTLEELESSRKTFHAVTTELNKQLDTAKQRESEIQTKMLRLSLENEKLAVLLESETNLVEMLKNELLGVKRALKFAITGTDVGCEESERYGRCPRVRFADISTTRQDTTQSRAPIADCQCHDHDHDIDSSQKKIYETTTL